MPPNLVAVARLTYNDDNKFNPQAVMTYFSVLRTLSNIRYRLHSNASQTIITVIFIVFTSIALSLWLFWRSLYLPELKNHASYLASEITMIDSGQQQWAHDEKFWAWLTAHTHIKIVRNPDEFPVVVEKTFVELFTDVLAKEVSNEIGRPVRVYFKFKPTPKLWIQDSRYPNQWLAEPISHYSQYSTGLLIGFLVGLPILTILTILLLIRALNRPLKQLGRAAGDYITLGKVTHLPTSSGPSEIRQVNTAFNRLFTNLHQTQKERTIMLAGISHDLRTPLTRMRLTAEMLPDEFFKEGLIYDIEDMDAILEQFMSFMKDGSDEEAKPTRLDVICHEIMVQFSDIAFIYKNEVDEAVWVRPLSIKRLLINLVNNATRYGRPPIHLVAQILRNSDIHLQDSEYDTLLLCVKDEGDGVIDSELERIMQPFERGETARTTQGSGLGLAIVGRIAHLHHGRVEAINHPEGGLQVCVYIPLINPDDMMDSALVESAS